MSGRQRAILAIALIVIVGGDSSHGFVPVTGSVASTRGAASGLTVTISWP